MASAKAVAALGGTAGALAGPALPMFAELDDAIADEIARMPLGHLPKPLRKPADRQRIVESLLKLGYPAEQIEARLKVYEGVDGVDHDSSNFNTFEVPPDIR